MRCWKWEGAGVDGGVKGRGGGNGVVELDRCVGTSWVGEGVWVGELKKLKSIHSLNILWPLQPVEKWQLMLEDGPRTLRILIIIIVTTSIVTVRIVPIVRTPTITTTSNTTTHLPNAQSFDTSSLKISIVKLRRIVRHHLPIVALPVVRTTLSVARLFHKTVVERQIVTDTVLPSLFPLWIHVTVVWKFGFDELINLIQRHPLIRRRLDGHRNKRHVAVRRFIHSVSLLDNVKWKMCLVTCHGGPRALLAIKKIYLRKRDKKVGGAEGRGLLFTLEGNGAPEK